MLKNFQWGLILISNSNIIEKAKELGLEKIAFLHTTELTNDFKVIISASLSYNYNWNNESESAFGYIARYTTANFYKLLRIKLKALGDFIYQQTEMTMKKNELYHISINSNLNDKQIALQSGLGNILNNSLISVNHKGCKFVLGNLLINEDVDMCDSVIHQVNECGSCHLCIDSCPTGALKENRLFDKSICLQHLSSQIGDEFDSKLDYIIPHWNERFFGCTRCVDVCPLNNKNQQIECIAHELPGYIGTVFTADDCLKTIKKGEFKKKFTGNQLGANWIPEVALIRNYILMNFKNNKSICMEMYNSIDKSDLDTAEKKYLKKIILLLKNYDDISIK